MRISIVLGAVSMRKLTEVTKNSEKDPLHGFKVIQGHRIWHQSNEHVRLVVINNSNFGLLSHTLSSDVGVKVENRLSYTPLSHLTHR